jgi:hypothetical protein
MGLMDRFPWSKGEIVLATSKEWGRQGFFFKLAKVVYLLIYIYKVVYLLTCKESPHL